MFDLSAKRVFVCDLDGMLFMGCRLMGPAVCFGRERAGGFESYGLTSNTSKTPEASLAKTGGAGINAGAENILTPLTAVLETLGELL